MNVDGKAYRSIRLVDDNRSVEIIDQTALPHLFRTIALSTMADAANAIAGMQVRGAPLIGATAACGLALAMNHDPSDANLDHTLRTLAATRPTAVNLMWALKRVGEVLLPLPPRDRGEVAWELAGEICDEDVALNRALGERGLPLIEAIWDVKGRADRVDVLTHCNAGWLATVDWGTALAPIYLAHERGIPVHVWVDETRPRNQGASLTAWELTRHGIPCTLIVDNAGGHLMRQGRVDICFVGTDRTTARGDVCNKIGTYLKALAARDNNLPFHVCAPSPSIDWSVEDGLAEIPIEDRGAEEVTTMSGLAPEGEVVNVDIAPAGVMVSNPGFDVTPARLITGLITERGVCPATRAGLAGLFPEFASDPKR
ncbi:MAG: S-methyl-5-thioribose-1-phosphate isomerase [bacterium]|nr:S-methyl-5-thioribose-1-phosphate isomerase [bacterium]